MDSTTAVVPVSTVLLWGTLRCWKLTKPVMEGSKEGVLGPSWVSTLELTPLEEPAGAPFVLMLTPLRLTLTGPDATPWPGFRNKPPPSARRRTSRASRG